MIGLKRQQYQHHAAACFMLAAGAPISNDPIILPVGDGIRPVSRLYSAYLTMGLAVVACHAPVLYLLFPSLLQRHERNLPAMSKMSPESRKSVLLESQGFSLPSTPAILTREEDMASHPVCYPPPRDQSGGINTKMTQSIQPDP